MNIETTVNALTSFGPGWVLWLLVALSVVGLAIALERGVYLFSTRDDVQALREALRQDLAHGQIERATRRLQESPSFEARIAAAGLEADGAGSAEERMAAESQHVQILMEKRLMFLGTVGNNAPFVGLLGTVIGIVRAFHELDQAAGKLSAGLMAEVGEALVATAAGLLVALPAVACFNLFQRMVRVRVGHADVLGREVLAYFRRENGDH